MTKALDLVGQRFGRLVVIERVESDKWGQSRWKCKCDCGNEIITKGNCLVRGHTKSCGCYNLEKCIERLPVKRTHCLSRTPLYRCWILMKQRCFNSDRKDWMEYGGRGITICDEWLDSSKFFEWALVNGYKEGLTLDRIDTNGNYEPSNCRWATAKEQTRNRRNTVKTTFHGEEITLGELSERYDIPYTTLWWRYKHGHVEDDLVKPVDQTKRSKNKKKG